MAACSCCSSLGNCSSASFDEVAVLHISTRRRVTTRKATVRPCNENNQVIRRDYLVLDFT